MRAIHDKSKATRLIFILIQTHVDVLHISNRGKVVEELLLCGVPYEVANIDRRSALASFVLNFEGLKKCFIVMGYGVFWDVVEESHCEPKISMDKQEKIFKGNSKMIIETREFCIISRSVSYVPCV